MKGWAVGGKSPAERSPDANLCRGTFAVWSAEVAEVAAAAALGQGEERREGSVQEEEVEAKKM